MGRARRAAEFRPHLGLVTPLFYRALLAAGLSAGILIGPHSSSLAGPINYSADEGAANFGRVDQNELGALFGSCGCGPAAAVNSFVYLENAFTVYGTSLTPLTMVDEIKTAQNLAQNYMHTTPPSDTNRGGTTIQNFINGKMEYMESVASGRTDFEAQVSPKLNAGTWEGSKDTEFVDPTALFLAQQLKDGEDVELLISQFDETGKETFGHYLTVTGLNWINQKGDGFMAPSDGATLSFIDPDGAVLKQDRFIYETDGALFFNGPTGVGFEITAIVAESAHRKTNPVPEPPSVLLLGFALFGLACLRRCRLG